MTTTIGADQVIVVAYVVRTVAFQPHTVRLEDGPSLSQRLQRDRVQLCEVDVGISVKDIHPSVVVHQEARVIEHMMREPIAQILLQERFQTVLGGVVGRIVDHRLPPFTLHGGRRIDKRAIGIAGEEHMKLTAPISDGSSPLPMRISVSTLQVEVRVIVEPRHHIGSDGPVHQVVAFQYGHPRHHEHAGRYEVEGIVHLNHIRVGQICPKHRVGESPVAIITGLCHGWDGTDCQHQRQYNVKRFLHKYPPRFIVAK